MFKFRTPLRTRGTFAVAGALLLTGGASSLQAGAFSLSDQSASAVGTSFANGASPEDPSTLFTNPAGMAYLDGVQTESSYEYIHPRAEFDNQGSRYSFGLPIKGSDGGGAARGASISQTYLTATLFKSPEIGQFTMGIGITVPFGEMVDYDPHWVGRYQSLRSALRTLDYDISAAYRWKFISIGAGFDAQYSSAVLTQAIDFGLLGFANHIPGYAPGNHDATLRLEGSDVSYGFNVGGIIEYLQPGQVSFLGSGKLGVSYRSGITQNYTGQVTFRNVPELFRLGNNTFSGQPGSATLRLPETYNFAISQQVGGKFNLMAGLTWTRWGRLDSIPINFGNPSSQAALVSDPALGRPGVNNQFTDAFRYVGAIEYMPIKSLTLRIGGGYDETPVPDQAVRNSRIPDGDRILLSAGLKYHAFGFNSPIFPVHVDTDIELSYLHEFVNSPRIESVDTSGHILSGRYNEQVNVASLAVIFRYGPKGERGVAHDAKDSKDHSK